MTLEHLRGAPLHPAQLADGEALVAGLPLRRTTRPSRTTGSAPSARRRRPSPSYALNVQGRLGRVHQEPLGRLRIVRSAASAARRRSTRRASRARRAAPAGRGRIPPSAGRRPPPSADRRPAGAPRAGRPCRACPGSASPRRSPRSGIRRSPSAWKQLGRANPPFVADEHGVGLELPGGMKSGQYVTHAAHRMRDTHPSSPPRATAITASLRASGLVVSDKPAVQASSSWAHSTERYAPMPISAKLRRLSVPGSK